MTRSRGARHGERREGSETRIEVFARIGSEGTPVAIHEWGWIALSRESIGAAPDPRTSPPAVVVTGIAPAGDAIAAALVPEALSGAARRNGVRAAAGLHLLAHGDRLELGENALWVSGATGAVPVAYDPEVHGADARCARTKALLAPGEPVVRCPGTPASPACGLLFRASAWTVARCHGCGRDPAQRGWTPPVPKPRRTLHEHLARYFDA